MPRKAFKKTSWAPSAASEVSPSIAADEVIDRRMIVSDEPVEGRFRAGLQLVDEIGSSRPQERALAQSDTAGLSGPTFTSILADAGPRTILHGWLLGPPCCGPDCSGFVSTNPETRIAQGL